MNSARPKPVDVGDDYCMTVSKDRVVQLLVAHRAMLMGYISLIVGDAHLAEDVFQEVAIVVVGKWNTLHDVDGFPAWARQIARYKALNALRDRRSLPHVMDERILDLLEKEWVQEEPDIAAVLRRCLEKLSPHARTLLDLRYGSNLSGKALAEKVGQSLNTVYVSLSRIYRALSTCIRLGGDRRGALS